MTAARWREIVQEFVDCPERERLELLLELSNSLEDLPARLSNHPELLERVEECQSPVYLITEGDAAEFVVWLTAPREAPTTRAFAAIVQRAMSGRTAQEIVQFPDDFADQLQLAQLVSPLRLHGLRGMVSRVKRRASSLGSS